jgi:hypothetical protein
MTTFGSVTTKFDGSAPPVASKSVVMNTSSVRTARPRRSSVNGLMRIPTNGGSVPARIPRATSCAAAAA